MKIWDYDFSLAFLSVQEMQLNFLQQKVYELRYIHVGCVQQYYSRSSR